MCHSTSVILTSERDEVWLHPAELVLRRDGPVVNEVIVECTGSRLFGVVKLAGDRCESVSLPKSRYLSSGVLERSVFDLDCRSFVSLSRITLVRDQPNRVCEEESAHKDDEEGLDPAWGHGDWFA